MWLKTLSQFYSNLDYYTFQWIGNISNHQEQMINEMLKCDKCPSNLPIFLINIEAFSHKKIYDLVGIVLRYWSDIWIMDESTTIKSPTTKRTKGILGISHLADYKRILSGYPVLKSPEDLYSQIQFLGSNKIPYSSFYAFRNEFCITRKLDNRVSITIGPKNIEKLAQIIKPFSIRITKKQCLDLPDKIHTARYIEMSEDQKHYYSEMKKQGYITLKDTGKESFASTLLVQLEKLHQIANGLMLSLQSEIECSKYKTLMEIIRDEIGDNQVVVWSSYVKNIERILTWFAISGRAIYGATPINERDKIITDFQASKFQILICNPATAKYGLNLTAASYAIYFNNSFKLEDRIQSEDRLHRIGQVNKVTYIDLLSENTIEEKILDVLEHKHNVGAQIMGDEWKSWFN